MGPNTANKRDMAKFKKGKFTLFSMVRTDSSEEEVSTAINTV